MDIQTINILAILFSPVIAVLVTVWLQSRKEKRDRKNGLFITLMAHRKSYPPNQDWVQSLNLIDIAFANNNKVTKLWHEYFDLLGSAQTQTEYQNREHKYIELLSAMAKDLGYKNLQQVDIDKFYSPVAYENQLQANVKLQEELLRVLENTSHVIVEKKDNNKPA